MNKKEITVIALTGGPCAGKSTALSKIEHLLTSLNYNVLIIPESSTELLSNGITIKKLGNFEFQKLLLKHQLQKEEIYLTAANLLKGKTVIICDRGTIDSKAYVGSKSFNKILKNLKLNESQLMNRYDAVIHLKTAADGAEEFYSNENNPARYETAEQARLIDNEILNVWTGHSKLKIISNDGGFSKKIDDVLNNICLILGIPKPLEIERKFLIEMPNLIQLETKYNAKHYKINQDYLQTKRNIERRVRKISKPDGKIYYYTEKKKINNISRFETERKITESEYNTFLQFKDKKLRTITKERYYFVYNNQYFELDVYPEFKDKAILELELSYENQKISFPNFIKVIEEVTNNQNYKNYNLAKK